MSDSENSDMNTVAHRNETDNKTTDNDDDDEEEEEEEEEQEEEEEEAQSMKDQYEDDDEKSTTTNKRKRSAGDANGRQKKAKPNRAASTKKSSDKSDDAKSNRPDAASGVGSLVFTPNAAEKPKSRTKSNTKSSDSADGSEDDGDPSDDAEDDDAKSVKGVDDASDGSGVAPGSDARSSGITFDEAHEMIAFIKPAKTLYDLRRVIFALAHTAYHSHLNLLGLASEYAQRSDPQLLVALGSVKETYAYGSQNVTKPTSKCAGFDTIIRLAKAGATDDPKGFQKIKQKHSKRRQREKRKKEKEKGKQTSLARSNGTDVLKHCGNFFQLLTAHSFDSGDTLKRQLDTLLKVLGRLRSVLRKTEKDATSNERDRLFEQTGIDADEWTLEQAEQLQIRIELQLQPLLKDRWCTDLYRVCMEQCETYVPPPIVSLSSMFNSFVQYQIDSKRFIKAVSESEKVQVSQYHPEKCTYEPFADSMDDFIRQCVQKHQHAKSLLESQPELGTKADTWFTSDVAWKYNRPSFEYFAFINGLYHIPTATFYAKEQYYNTYNIQEWRKGSLKRMSELKDKQVLAINYIPQQFPPTGQWTTTAVLPTKDMTFAQMGWKWKDSPGFVKWRKNAMTQLKKEHKSQSAKKSKEVKEVKEVKRNPTQKRSWQPHTNQPSRHGRLRDRLRAVLKQPIQPEKTKVKLSLQSIQPMHQPLQPLQPLQIIQPIQQPLQNILSMGSVGMMVVSSGDDISESSDSDEMDSGDKVDSETDSPCDGDRADGDDDGVRTSTQSYDRLMSTQNWDDETGVTWYYCVGRGFRLVFDGDKLLPYLTGPSNAGKTTFFRPIYTLVPKHLRADMSVNAQSTFGLAQVLGKLVTIIGEGHEMHLSQCFTPSVVLLMTAAEEILVPKKFCDARSFRFDQPVFGCGNGIPPLKQEMREMTNRFLPFPCEIEIDAKDQDSQLNRKIDEEVGAILDRANTMYLRARRILQDKLLRSAISSECLINKRRDEKELDTFDCFFREQLDRQPAKLENWMHRKPHSGNLIEWKPSEMHRVHKHALPLPFPEVQPNLKPANRPEVTRVFLDDLASRYQSWFKKTYPKAMYPKLMPRSLGANDKTRQYLWTNFKLFVQSEKVKVANRTENRWLVYGMDWKRDVIIMPETEVNQNAVLQQTVLQQTAPQNAKLPPTAPQVALQTTSLYQTAPQSVPPTLQTVLQPSPLTAEARPPPSQNDCILEPTIRTSRWWAHTTIRSSALPIAAPPTL